MYVTTPSSAKSDSGEFVFVLPLISKAVTYIRLLSNGRLGCLPVYTESRSSANIDFRQECDMIHDILLTSIPKCRQEKPLPTRPTYLRSSGVYRAIDVTKTDD